MGEYDRSSKWLIQHHGGSILRLVGAPEVVSWRPLQAEVVQPGQLPDGLLEVQFAGADEPTCVILEIATYPELRLREQLLRDTLLVLLDRRVLPEVYAVVLCPKGKQHSATGISLFSPQGSAEVRVRWRIVEVWNLPAEELLGIGDPGLAPWIPLTRNDGPVEPLLERCRRIIEERGAPEERASLFAVAQVLASLRYNDPGLIAILGGRTAMIESPLLKEIVDETRAEAVAETKAEAILAVLRARLGPVPTELADAVRRMQNSATLDPLLDVAACCPDLDRFRAALKP